MILGIETATPVSSVALGDAEGVVAESVIEGGAMHAEYLVPAIRSMCATAGFVLGDLRAVGVDIGPGLFTGLRVGVAAAKSLAMALGISAVGVVSIDALALPVLRDSPCRLVAAIDARRGEVFAASISPGIKADPRVMSPSQLAERVEWEIGASPGTGVGLVGDGFTRHFPAGMPGAVRLGEDFPTASSVVLLAAEALDRGAGKDPDCLVPLYLRAPDVRINWETRSRSSDPNAGSGR